MRIRLKPIDQQTIVITGASSGNGLSAALQASRRGAAVVLVARNRESLDQIERDIVASGGRATSVAVDVASRGAAEEIVAKAVEVFGGFDSWVNNAAAGVYGTLEQVPVEDHERIFAVNYFGTLYACLAAARHLKERGGGAIVNVGSILGDRAIIQQGPYSASKHAIQGLTDTLRMELEHQSAGISVTLIKPGGCGTPYPEHARNYMNNPPRIPQPLYHPDIIGDAILFACTHRKRSMYIGGGGVAASVIGQLAPRITDLVMEAIGTRMQQEPSDAGDASMRDNLYRPRTDGKVSGTQENWVRKSSVAVALQKPSRGMWFGAAVAIAATAFISTRPGKVGGKPRARR